VPAENKDISLQAYDELIRAKEAKNVISVEGENLKGNE